MPSHGESMTGARATEAVRHLAEQYGGRLYGLAFRLCGTREEAEDLVQEVFLSAMRAWDGFRGDADPRTWLFRIAVNACRRMHRTRSGEPLDIGSLDALLPFGEPLIAVIVDEQPGVVQETIRAEALARLEHEIAGLPEAFRMPLVLKDIVGFSVVEVAEILGLEAGTVRSRVHRARLRLRSAVDAALPRSSEPAPPPRYDEQTCLDLLNAKQEALDRGVRFDSSVICARCRSVFSSLDLTREICGELSMDRLPEDVRDRLAARLAGTG